VNLDAFKVHLEWAEDRRSKPYHDSATPPRLTIGVGRNLTDRGLRESEIDFLLANDMDEAIGEASQLPYWGSLNDARQLCVADMLFNLGRVRFGKFVRLNAALVAGDYETAADEMERSAWYAQVGRRAVRLVNAMRSGEWNA
jgi:lysozyme